MSNSFLKMSAAAALLAAAPALASAQSVAFSTSPVAVTACSVVASYDPLAFSGAYNFGTIAVREASDVRVSYVNHGSVPATTVKVAFTAGDYSQNITAKGTFAPGVAIDRSFAADDNANNAAKATCRVAEVDFADGTAWHAGPQDIAQTR